MSELKDPELRRILVPLPVALAAGAYAASVLGQHRPTPTLPIPGVNAGMSEVRHEGR